MHHWDLGSYEHPRRLCLRRLPLAQPRAMFMVVLIALMLPPVTVIPST